MIVVPDRTEAAEYYFRYIDQVPAGDIRDVVNHLNDTERLFVFRAFWFAREFDSPLPSFDQHVAVSVTGADDRSWVSLFVEEFRAVRAATLAFFQTLPKDAWTRRCTASGNPFTVRSLAYLAAGHVTHHMTILRERYLHRPA
jgi:hypothetical protein